MCNAQKKEMKSLGNGTGKAKIKPNQKKREKGMILAFIDSHY